MDSKANVDGNVKEEKGSNDETILIKLKNLDGEEVVFKIKKTTKLSKIAQAYCQRNNADPNRFRFLYNGNGIDTNKTPKDYDMENEDQIDVMTQQVGGSN